MTVLGFIVRLGNGLKNMESYYLSRLESKLTEMKRKYAFKRK